MLDTGELSSSLPSGKVKPGNLRIFTNLKLISLKLNFPLWQTKHNKRDLKTQEAFGKEEGARGK